MKPAKTNLPSHPGIEEVRQWMEGIDPEPEHELQVTRLALMLFDQLEPLHGMGKRERILLEAGALLHDLGMCVTNKKHHKNSYELIRKHKFLMWRPEEVDLFALIARYHRKAEPSMDHAPYASLPEGDRIMVRKLASILRLADGLDRAHLSTVQDMDLSYDESTITIRLHAYRDCSTEIWGAERKSSLFEQVFSRRLNLQAVDGYRAQRL
jgi:exopolyphosphatase/guanosine-5'-triphosphate,3'-diphosphate pyrophosphatase